MKEYGTLVERYWQRNTEELGIKRVPLSLQIPPGLDWKSYLLQFFFSVALQPIAGQCLLILEVSRSHSLDPPQSVGLLWTSDQLVAETSTWQHTTLNGDIHGPDGIRT
jgi:hypothetical protein